MTFRDTESLRQDLAVATGDLDLSTAEQRILDWLAGWDADTVGTVISLLHKARRGPLEPPRPTWVEPYG